MLFSHKFSMRWLLSLLCLFTATIASAQTYVSAIESGKVYRIYNVKTGTALYDDASGNPKQASALDGLSSFMWTVTTHADGGYTVKNLSTGNYLQAVTSNDEGASMSASEQACYINSIEEAKFAIVKTSDATVSLNIHGTYGTIVGWRYNNDDGTNDTGSLWQFEEVTEEDMAEVDAFKTGLLDKINANEGLVRIVVSDGKVLTDTNGQMIAVEAGDVTQPENWNQVWVMETSGTGFTLRNLDTGRSPMSGCAHDAPITTSRTVSTLYVQNNPYEDGNFNISINSSNITYGWQSMQYVAAYNGVQRWVVYEEGRGGYQAGSGFTFEAVEGITREGVSQARLQAALTGNNGLVRIVVSDGKVITDTNGQMTVAEKADDLSQSSAWNQVWVMQASGEGYILRNLATGNYPMTNCGHYNPITTSETSYPVYVQTNPYEIGNYNISINSSNITSGWQSLQYVANYNGVQRWVVYETGRGGYQDGSGFVFEAANGVSLDDVAAARLQEILGANNGLVRLTTNRNGGDVMTQSNETMAMSDKAEALDYTQVWLIEALADGGYTMRSAATGKYAGMATADNTAMPLNDTPTTMYIKAATDLVAHFEDYYISSTSSFDEKTLLNDGVDNGVVRWSVGDLASAWKIEAATDADYATVQENCAAVDALPANRIAKILAANDGLVRIYSNKTTTHVATNNGHVAKTTTADSEGTTTPSQIWQITALDGGGYAIRSMSTGKYVRSLATEAQQYTPHPIQDDTPSTFYIGASTIEATPEAFFISSTSTFDDYSCWHHDADNQIVIWHADCAESTWNIVAATDADLEELEENIAWENNWWTPETGKYYYIYNGFWTDNDVITEDNSLLTVPDGITAGNKAQVWLLTANTDGKFSFKNLGTNKYIQAGTDGSQYATGDTEAVFTITAVDNSVAEEDRWYHITDANGNLFAMENRQVLNSVSDKSTNAANQYYWRFKEVDTYKLSGTAASITAGSIYRLQNIRLSVDLMENASGELKGQANVNNFSNYWRVADAGDGKFTLQNIITDNYIAANTGGSGTEYSVGTTAGGYVIQRLATTYPTEGVYAITDDTSLGNETYNAMNCNESYYNLLKWQAGSDAASHWRFYSVKLTDEEIAAAKVAYADEQKWPNVGDNYLTFFTDHSATALKDEYQAMSDDELRTAMNVLPSQIVNMALKIKNNTWATWEKEFRVADYGAFSNADYWSGVLNTSPYGKVNNPTGIVADTDDYVCVFVKDAPKDGATLKLQVRGGFYVTGQDQEITLQQGFNRIKPIYDEAHVFVHYESADGTLISDWPALTIHVDGGEVNGYVDVKKHDDEDWVSMNNAGLFFAENIDLLGDYAQLRIYTSDAKQNGNRITPIIKEFDWYVHSQLDIMGLTAVPDSLSHLADAENAYEQLYPKYINNRMMCINRPGGGYSAGNYIINLEGSGFYNYDGVKNRGGCVWAPAHEFGHQNQGAIHLAATTEISNNFFSNMSIWKGGTSTSRGWHLQNMQEMLALGDYHWTKVPITADRDMIGVYMYFQLYLYYHAAGHDELFYQKLFKLLRANPLQKATGTISGANDYLHFYKMACDAAGEDLTEYFEYFGFFEPVENLNMASYGSWTMTTTQKQIDDAKAYVAAKNYPKANSSMIFIDDRVVTSYCSDGVTPKASYVSDYTNFNVETNITDFPGAQYSAFEGDVVSRPNNLAYTMNGNTLTLNVDKSEVTSAAGIKFYNSDGKIVYVAATSPVVLPDAVAEKVDHSKTVITLTDGTVMPLYNTAAEGVYAQKIYHGDETSTTRYTNAADNAIFSASRDGKNAVALLEGDNIPEALSSITNVAVNKVFQSLILTDKNNFHLEGEGFTAKKITYSRDNTAGFNSVCLPFALKLDDLPGGSKIEVLSGSSGGTVLFDDTVTEVAAGTPCLVWCPDDVTRWDLDITDRTVVATPVDADAEDGAFTMKGSFKNDVIGPDKYKLNGAGTKFGKTTTAGKVTAFRVWMEAGTQSGANSFNIKHGGIVSDLTSPVFGRPESDIIYDLSGRPVARPERGRIYIKNGRTVLIK